MAIVQRRVFYAKTGKADDILALNQEFAALAEEAGAPLRGRVLTDYLSGRSDRVVNEIEVSSIGEFESIMASAMGDSALGSRLRSLQQRLESLVEYSEVEYWTIQVTR